MSIVPRMTHPVALLVDEMSRMIPRFRSVFGAALAEAGLSSMEITVLANTVEAPRPPTVPQIGRSLGHPRQVIQRAANALIERGLIGTAPNPDHKRAPLLVPTPEGRAIKARVDATAIRDAEALQAAMPDVDFPRLSEDLRALRRRMEAYIREGGGADGGE